jgi:hypothetical protein
MRSTSRCSECGEPGATHHTRDAADKRHVFHPACYAAMAWFLDGHDDAPPQEYVRKVVRGIERAAKSRAR